MPAISVREAGRPPMVIADGDSVVFFNFRSDRPRQLTQALIGPEQAGVDFPSRPHRLAFVTLAPYADYLNAPAAFEPATVEQPLGWVVANAGAAQFHSAETEKYAHVTYFLNGGREEPFPGEERVLAPSPKVATYDLQPEMSAREVADAVVAAVASGRFGLIVLNFANCDMVGHTGVLSAAIAATEAVDHELGRVIDATLAAGGVALVIADHGNAERMLVPGTEEPMTAHTTNPVPCVLVAGEAGPRRSVRLRDGGRLADVAPTLLQLMGIAQPPVMTGVSLIERA
jgi:2,3-bisphosphoglycerate-independent phosphoglycerate mutase